MSSFLPTQHASFNFFRHFLKIIIVVFLYENVYLDCEKKIYLNWGERKISKGVLVRARCSPCLFSHTPQVLISSDRGCLI